MERIKIDTYIQGDCGESPTKVLNETPETDQSINPLERLNKQIKRPPPGPLAERALSIDEAAYGPDHPRSRPA
jgi:hypothetical protein